VEEFLVLGCEGVLGTDAPEIEVRAEMAVSFEPAWSCGVDLVSDGGL